MSPFDESPQARSLAQRAQAIGAVERWDSPGLFCPDCHELVPRPARAGAPAPGVRTSLVREIACRCGGVVRVGPKLWRATRWS